MLTGFLPLVLLYLTNKSVYTRLEFIFSLATVLLPISDLVSRVYFLYGYSESKQKENFQKISISVFCSQIVLILVISLFGFFSQENDLFYAIIRLAYLSLYFFLFDYLRIENKQDKLVRESIIINITILVFAAVDYLLIRSNLLFPFIATVQLGYIAYRLNLKRKIIVIPSSTKVWAFLKKSFKYSFPVFINLGISVLVQNYLKMHFYQTDNKQDMLELSVLLRLGMAIQMMHALMQAYFTKKIYLKEITFKRFFAGIYLPLIMFAGFALSFAEVIYFRYLNTSIPVHTNVILFVNLYFLLWCTSAIVEIIFTSSNRNMWLLYINVLSLALTLLVFYGFNMNQSNQTAQLVALMCCQPALFIMGTALFYKKLFPKVF